MLNAFISALVVCLSVPASAQERRAHEREALTNEILRVQSEVERVVPADQRPGPVARLDRAATAARSGRAYVALQELEGPWETVAAHGFARDASGVADLGSFTAYWKRHPVPGAPPPARGRAPIVVEALASAAEARAPALYHASLPYAQDANLQAGLYILGESQAVVRFATFARSLAWGSTGTPQSFRTLSAELDVFEKEITGAYERMVPAQHPTYVLTSVALKRARTLNDRGSYPGALLEYLTARYRFGLLREPAGTADAPSRIADARRALEGAADHSIALLFVEIAETALASTDANARMGAAVILDDILPAYHSALRPPEAPAKTLTGGAGVTITLVRWPFT